MAWMCQRCQKRIFAPRKDSYSYVMEWRYRPTLKDLEVEMCRLQDLADEAVVTHVHCEYPSIDGFADRMKHRLRIPAKATHPLLF